MMTTTDDDDDHDQHFHYYYGLACNEKKKCVGCQRFCKWLKNTADHYETKRSDLNPNQPYLKAFVARDYNQKLLVVRMVRLAWLCYYRGIQWTWLVGNPLEGSTTACGRYWIFLWLLLKFLPLCPQNVLRVSVFSFSAFVCFRFRRFLCPQTLL